MFLDILLSQNRPWSKEWRDENESRTFCSQPTCSNRSTSWITI